MHRAYLNRGGVKTDDIDFRIENAAASLAMEGMIVTEAEKELVRKCAKHEMTYDELVESVVKEFTRPLNE